MKTPDFIVGGAMKSGTSYICNIINSRDDVFIPSSEIHFFSMGDVVQSPEIIESNYGRVNYDVNSDEKIEWYTSFFAPARDTQLIGGYSTTYLPSKVAPERIREALPDAKLIFMLRNPADRTYSHYWHLVNSGRATRTFKEELVHGRSTLHLRSFYKPQLERYFQLFPRDQIKIILFERFIRETQSVVDEVCSYLRLSGSVDLNNVQTHTNTSWYPRWTRTYLSLNYLLSGHTDRYQAYWPGEPSEPQISRSGTGTRMLHNILSKMRREIPRQESCPPMDSSLRKRLNSIYARENKGIGEMTGCDISKYWPFS